MRNARSIQSAPVSAAETQVLPEHEKEISIGAAPAVRLEPCPAGPAHGGASFGPVVGRSPAMRRLCAMLPRVAASSLPVLLEGETGTGKGLLAEAIHGQGPRAGRPFVAVDCAAIPATLIESELFGHAKGAFTGALHASPGAFEAARGGTVFLDEVGELPLDMQPKLLRVLEQRVIKRIGSQEPVRLDVRVIAATNRDLRAEVERGSFRADLYYRLHGVRIVLPPLHERADDIPDLVALFFQRASGTAAPPPPDLVERLSQRRFPGNVRELRAAVERAVLLGDLEPAEWDDPFAPTPPADVRPSPFRVAKERAILAWEKRYFERLMARARDNLSLAARMASMDRNYLRNRLRKLGLHGKDDCS